MFDGLQMRTSRSQFLALVICDLLVAPPLAFLHQSYIPMLGRISRQLCDAPTCCFLIFCIHFERTFFGGLLACPRLRIKLARPITQENLDRWRAKTSPLQN